MLASAAAALCAAGCGDLSREELTRGVESLSALAAQGGLVANGVTRDATKTTYVRVMAKTLGGEAEHEAEKLSDAEPEPAVRDERNGAVAIAGQIADLFTELQTFPGDQHRGAEVEVHLKEVKGRADALAERLSGGRQ